MGHHLVIPSHWYEVLSKRIPGLLLDLEIFWKSIWWVFNMVVGIVKWSQHHLRRFRIPKVKPQCVESSLIALPLILMTGWNLFFCRSYCCDAWLIASCSLIEVQDFRWEFGILLCLLFTIHGWSPNSKLLNVEPWANHHEPTIMCGLYLGFQFLSPSWC